MYLNHLTLTTGHLARTSRGDVPAEVTVLLAPWLAVITHPTLAAHLGATEWLGDFERCVAWAWITRHPAVESAS